MLISKTGSIIRSCKW